MEYFLNLDLSKLMHTEFHEREIDGKLTKCISIPLDINGIKIRRRREPHLYCIMTEMQPNPNGDIFRVKPYISDKKTFLKLYNSGWWKTMYYLGTVSKSSHKENKYYKNKNSVSLDDAMERE